MYDCFATSKHLQLNLTNAEGATTASFDSTTPTSNVFTLGGGDSTNDNAGTIAYCFHSVDGYSKVGSYTGNGSTDGTFVYTGFRPAYVMWKRTDAVANWVVQDTTRDIGNVSVSRLEPNTSNSEYTDNGNIDMLSNGFKMRTNYGYTNYSGATYIYLAFASVPFKFGNSR